MLKNPFYAGAYAYGKSEKRTAIVDGHPRKELCRDLGDVVIRRRSVLAC